MLGVTGVNVRVGGTGVEVGGFWVGGTSVRVLVFDGMRVGTLGTQRRIPALMLLAFGRQLAACRVATVVP